MNSFCDTVFVLVMMLRRREAGRGGKWNRAGHDGKGEKRKRGLFPLPIIHCALNIFFIIIAIFIWIPSEYPVGASAEERSDRGFPKVSAPWIYSYNLY